ncbi:hypothetical protein BDR07DRAFT_1613438 [Suillus spraguei]|nr:hypothetical protein BDR07DRAFT_1613438 [Suillus spraguei]
MTTMHTSEGEFILSSTHECWFNTTGDMLLLVSLTWIFGTVWEVLALCLAFWNAGGLLGTVSRKTHVLYFASFIAVTCLRLIIDFSPTLSTDEDSGVIKVYDGLLTILEVAQMFVLGPRLILSIREYHAKLVADSDAAICVTFIAFQERVHISTGSSV